MRAPLAPGSISLRLYPCPGSPEDQIAELRDQVGLAEAAGYDGAMVSEHHAGFPGYLPNPAQLAGFLLAATERLWVAPCPLLLPLKARALVAEELAWLAAAFPGRVGVGFAAGALPVDFELAEVPFDEVVGRFKDALPWTVRALRGDVDGPLADDAAIARCAAEPVPMVVAAQSPGAVRRAARLGLGVLYDSLQTAEVSASLSDAFRSATDGEPAGATILIRRVWIGAPPQTAIDAQMAHYRSYAPDAAVKNWADGDSTIVGTTGLEAAEQLAEVVRSSGCDTVNIRVQVAGLTAADVRSQMEHHATEFLPALRSLLS